MIELTIRIVATIAHVVSIAWFLDLCSILVDGPLSFGRRGHPDVDTVLGRIYWNKTGLLGDGKVICVTRGLRFLETDQGIDGDFRCRSVVEGASLSGANTLVYKLDFSKGLRAYRILPYF